MKKISKIFLLLFVVSIILISCKKDPEIIIEKEYITITDTLTVTDTLIIQDNNDTTTTFVLVRHSETFSTGTDPYLNSLGIARSLELRRILENVPLDAVLATNYKRTLQTADTVAVNHSLSVSIYDGFNIENTVDENLSLYKNKTILVVGHSNTTAEMLNILTGTTNFTTFPETEHDNIFIVTIRNKGKSKVTHMKFGN